jgi:hypothetical protein
MGGGVLRHSARFCQPSNCQCITICITIPALPPLGPLLRSPSTPHPHPIQIATSTLPAVSVADLVPLPSLKTECGEGAGLAVCPTLGLLVTSDYSDSTLSVFALPSGCPSTTDLARIGASRGAGAGAGAGLARVCTLGGAGSPAPMQFQFEDGGYMSGWMAFTGPATSRLLLVTDAGHDAVHVIDVVGRAHVGYVAAPGTIAGPRGVAGRGSLAAVRLRQCVERRQR